MSNGTQDAHTADAAEHAATARQWAARLDRWSRRLHLHGLLVALLDAAEPLAPIGAQLLWVAQPVLGLVTPRQEVDALARLLDAPGGIARLAAYLDDEPDSDTIGDEKP